MENRPVITVAGASPVPWAENGAWARYLEWTSEVYFPMLSMKVPGIRGLDRYRNVRESVEYPLILTLMHYENFTVYEDSLKNRDRVTYARELSSWMSRKVIDMLWSAPYELIKSFRSETPGPSGRENSLIDNAPFMHLEAYHLRPEDRGKYEKCLNEFGFEAFIPLMTRLPGLSGYDFYKNIGLTRLYEEREWDYPVYLSIVYFKDKKSFDNYTGCPELFAFQKILRNVFPLGLNLKWYVQYQLVRSWRK